ncbi:shikimate dehydrogenase [Pelomicrobium methylotrophicum]|uniref:Shikimate dehydrogenase (NADP(+)) n=1 Tax=Pelomicrobium methylotrophicum TaxID=2602750 RepID=A0A5C7EZY3_9PROT|nr:shikimate dehydrogenase [Pelomicrobium methylotrophicum]TXF12942.1 shikimate dehydrogenase [Pelomicrobium methylotrophicum]
MPDRYAVIGNPVAHSRSPWIHAEFARQTKQDLTYEAILAPLDGFARAVDAFREAGGKGMNVTLPFKQEAFDLSGVRTPRAEQAGAVNTLTFEGQRILGDNTDGIGLIRDLEENLEFTLDGRRVLLLGAGGAARGVLLPLLSRGVGRLVIANRTVSRAEALAGIARAAGFEAVAARGYGALSGEAFDLVINSTSVSLAGGLPPLPPGVFAPGALAYEMAYGMGTTPFLRFARENGAARIADGLGMLVEQAAESFQVWRGIRPATQPVIRKLAAELPPLD